MIVCAAMKIKLVSKPDKILIPCHRHGDAFKIVQASIRSMKNNP